MLPPHPADIDRALNVRRLRSSKRNCWQRSRWWQNQSLGMITPDQSARAVIAPPAAMITGPAVASLHLTLAYPARSACLQAHLDPQAPFHPGAGHQHLGMRLACGARLTLREVRFGEHPMGMVGDLGRPGQMRVSSQAGTQMRRKCGVLTAASLQSSRSSSATFTCLTDEMPGTGAWGHIPSKSCFATLSAE